MIPRPTLTSSNSDFLLSLFRTKHARSLWMGLVVRRSQRPLVAGGWEKLWATTSRQVKVLLSLFRTKHARSLWMGLAVRRSQRPLVAGGWEKLWATTFRQVKVIFPSSNQSTSAPMSLQQYVLLREKGITWHKSQGQWLITSFTLVGVNFA